MKNNFTKPRLLIVDDEVENQKYFQLVLRNDFETVVCDSGKDFFEKISSSNYDAVVMDVNLKGNENGIELIRRMKKSFSNQKVPVVCLSAHVYGYEDFNSDVTDIDVYLTKPVSRKLLIETLKDLTEENILT